MSFKLTHTPTFNAPVTVNVPNDKGGFDKNTFTAVFKRMTDDEVEELRRSGISNADLVRKVLTSWKMTNGETNESVPFSPENLEIALSILPTPLATAMAFWESVNGARSKN